MAAYIGLMIAVRGVCFFRRTLVKIEQKCVCVCAHSASAAAFLCSSVR